MPGRWPTDGSLVPPIVSPFFSFPFHWNTGTSANTYRAFPAANEAQFLPVWCGEPWVATTMWAQFSTVSGTVDLGIYTPDGVRIVSTGAVTAVTSVHSVGLTPTQLPAGLLYLAIVPSSTSTLVYSATPVWDGGTQVSVYRQASASPLPATATFAGCPVSFIWKFGALKSPRTVV